MIEFTDFGTLALQLAVIVFIVETTTEVTKAVFKDLKIITPKVAFFLALVIGIASAVALKISLFDTDNIIFFYVGVVLAGAIASRGANFLHDTLKTLKTLPKK